MVRNDSIRLHEQHQHEIDVGIAWAQVSEAEDIRHGIFVEPSATGHRLFFDLALYPSWPASVFTTPHDFSHFVFPKVELSLVERAPFLPELKPPRMSPNGCAHGGILLSLGFLQKRERHWITVNGEPAPDENIWYQGTLGGISESWGAHTIVRCNRALVLQRPSFGPADNYSRKSWLVSQAFWLCTSDESVTLLDPGWVNMSGQAHTCRYREGYCFFPKISRSTRLPYSK